MVKGPGLREIPKIFHPGRYAAHARPMGRDNRTGIMELTPMEGKRKEKYWSNPAHTSAQTSPITHTRSVDASISGSSVLGTAARTSGYGESSETSPTNCLSSKFGSYSRLSTWEWEALVTAVPMTGLRFYSQLKRRKH